MKRSTLLILLAHHINKAEPGLAELVMGTDDERTTIKVDGVNAGAFVRLVDERSCMGPRVPNGKQRIYIGPPRQYKRFHQQRNGIMNFEGAGKALVKLMRRR